MKVLGIDVGVNSIGWAVLDYDQDSEDGDVIALGSRIFPKGVKDEKGNESPKNEDRRTARSVRRNLRRRANKKALLKKELSNIGLWPSGQASDGANGQANDQAEIDELLNTNPYELRSKAVNEQISKYELGRVLLHLAQRKGYLSNSAKEEEDSETVGKAITELKEQLSESGVQTLGEYLYLKQQNHDGSNFPKIRGMYTARAMYLDEFEKIWDAQSKFYPELLNDNLKYGEAGKQIYPLVPQNRNQDLSYIQQFGIHGLLFFQRAVYWSHDTIGNCILEPEELRISKAHRLAEYFRIWNDINNLKLVYNTKTKERLNEPLTEEQREKLFKKLQYSKTASFNSIRKLLDIDPDIKFNYEWNTNARKGLTGVEIEYDLNKIIGEKYDGLNDWEKNRLSDILIDERLNDVTTRALLAGLREVALTDEQIDELLKIKIKSGRLSYSQKAIKKLLPYLQEGYLLETVNDEQESAKQKAGYEHSWDVEKEITKELPFPPDIPNPVVSVALFEMRKVVNAIVREFGLPDKIVVEFARESLKSIKDRAATARNQKKNRNENEKIKEELENECKISSPSKNDILRYKLWKEQQYRCAYSLKPISQEQLFSGAVHVDHILPRWRSLDDSYLNKVICFSSENIEKGDKTPYEWLAESQPEKLFAMQKFFDDFTYYPFNKKDRLTKDYKIEGFANKDLSNTRYIARETRSYLSNLLPKKDILVINGQLTAQLRYKLGLHNLLDEKGKTREDHRHHAIDAVVIALTNQGIVKKFSDAIKKNDDSFKNLTFEPIKGIRDKTNKKLENVIVSIKPTRKKRGQLHEESVYGATQQLEEPREVSSRPHAKNWIEDKETVTIRKNVDSLTEKEIGQIRDNTIRDIVQKHYDEHGKLGTEPIFMPSGQPIKKVRIAKKLKTAVPRSAKTPFQLVNPGSNYCFVITRNEKDKWVGKPFPLFDVGEKRVENEVMRLFINDTIRLGTEDEGYRFYKVTGTRADGVVYITPINDSRESSKRENLFPRSSWLQSNNCVKVEVDPLGSCKVVNYFTE